MINSNTNSKSIKFIRNTPKLLSEAMISGEVGLDACPWLDEYIEFSRKWSPESFDGYHEACALAILSIVAAGRVIFDLGGPRKTNLNILLVGRTSIHAKSTASKIAIDLLAEADLDWLLASDETTPQKLIADMSSVELPDNFNVMSDKEKQKSIHSTLTAGQRGWIVDEFGDKIKAMMQPDGIMAGIKGLIRTLDGAPKKYEYSTISRGRNSIINPYLPILGNITIADLAPYAKRGNTLWGDGFFARLATPTPPNDILKFGRFPNQERIFPDSLISPIVEWNDRLGFPQYKIVESQDKKILKFKQKQQEHLKISQEVYDKYYEYRNELRRLIVYNQNTDLDGNYARFPEKALRIAALFASFENNDHVKLNHWIRAQAIAERWKVGLHRLYQQIMESNDDQSTRYIRDLPIEDQIIRAIAIKKNPSAREISQFTSLKMDILKPVLGNLASAGKVLYIPIGTIKRYFLPSENIKSI